MKEFEPDQFFFMGGIHSAWKMFPDSSNLTQEQRQDWLNDVGGAETLCRRLGLTQSELATQRIKNVLSENRQISTSELVKLNDELDHRMIDEMKSRKFFSIEPGKEVFLSGTDLFGTGVSSAFPSAAFDIEEAGKCLAFERWTASVSHLMKILELGLSVLAKDLGITSGHENWQNLIEQIQKRIRTINKETDGQDWKEKEQFYSEAALQFQFVKNAWRNHVMHIRQVNYDEGRAISIYTHVKEFMMHLGSRCRE